jgi:hypothetical protein
VPQWQVQSEAKPRGLANRKKPVLDSEQTNKLEQDDG